MYKPLALILAVLIFFVSCTKTSPPVTVTVIIRDTTKTTVTDTVKVTVTDTLRSNFDYVTAHQWMYSKYYIGFVDTTNPGTLQYQRGASGNITNMDNERVTWNVDGTIDEIDDNGNHIPGTWIFGNDQGTIMLEHNSYGNFTAMILKLDKGHYDWYYLAIDGTVRYGQMIPAQ